MVGLNSKFECFMCFLQIMSQNERHASSQLIETIDRLSMNTKLVPQSSDQQHVHQATQLGYKNMIQSRQQT